MFFLRSATALLLALVASSALAQTPATTRVTGRVLDSHQAQPLPGATVSLVDSTVATHTDMDGRYMLVLPRGAFQLKFYAPGVGNVRVGWRGAKETEREVLELVDLVHLSPKALAEARADALELERRAYVIRKDLYGQTRPAEGP